MAFRPQQVCGIQGSCDRGDGVGAGGTGRRMPLARRHGAAVMCSLVAKRVAPGGRTLCRA